MSNYQDWSERVSDDAHGPESGSSSSFSLEEMDFSLPDPAPTPVRKWRADFDLLRPVLVEIPPGVRGPADFDADGIKIYVNSHFETESEAWERLECEIFGAVSQAGDHVRQAEANLAIAQAKAGEAAKRFARFWAGDRRRRG